MDEMKRLQILLEHNIEHNENHIDKLREMAEEGKEFSISSELDLAIEHAEKSNNQLAKALRKIRTTNAKQ